MATLLNIFRPTFCATLSHCYREIRLPIRPISGLQVLDDMIKYGRKNGLLNITHLDFTRSH